MSKECFYKKGASVIYHYHEWRKVYWNASGRGLCPAWKRATLVCPPRDENGRFTSKESDIEFMTLKDEQGKIFNALISEVEPDRDIESLSREELVKLFGQIRRGSIYLHDYNNTLGVFNDVVDDWYVRFWNHIVGLFGEEEAEKQDTAENFAEYVLCGDLCVE